MKPTRTWILICDAARARTFLNRGPGSGLEPIEGMSMETEHLRAREIGADKPGRSFESVGTARHAISPRSDPERLEEQRFAASLVSRLDKEAEHSNFDRLVLVAPPTMLGDLRAALTPRLAQRVAATLDKDLTKTPDHKLVQHLGDVLPV
jgi:protein required for attachment to host cells